MQIFKIWNILLLFVTLSMFSQNMEQYHAQKKESLRDIAKKFNVSYRDLKKANPNVSNRPKERTLINIPVLKETKLYDEVKHPLDLLPTDKEDLIKKSLLLQFKDSEKQVFKDTLSIHVVKPKETLYSLSKLYATPMAQLIKDNPVLSQEGLKIGQELKVPFRKPRILKASKNHVVKTKETWYSISKLYNVSIEALKHLNPEISTTGLKIASIIEIPVYSNLSDTHQNKNAHTVLKGETLYQISKKYGIGLPELLAENNMVVFDSLKVGSVLNLPQKKVDTITKSIVNPIYKQVPLVYQYNKQEGLNSVLERYKITKDSLISINPNFDVVMESGGRLLIGFDKKTILFKDENLFKDTVVTDKTVKITLMLPFDLYKNDTLSKKALFANKNSLPSIVSDIYLGAMLAIDSLKKQQVKIDFTLIDTEKSVATIQRKIGALKIINSDIIIGPLYSNITKYVASEMPNVPIYYPIYSSRQASFTSQNIIKTATQKKLFEQEIIQYIQENRKGEHLLLVGKQEHLSKLKSLRQLLSKKDSLGQVLKTDISLLTPKDGYIAKEDFLNKIRLEQPNWVLIADNNNVITADVFNNIINLPRDSILETPVKILSFEQLQYTDKIDYQTLAKYQYTYATDKIEYEELIDDDFEQMYLKENNQYPSHYATRGFAVTYDAILRFLKQDAPDIGGASSRYKCSFFYTQNGEKSNNNQAIFVNTIENSDKKGLRVVRLR